MGLGIEGRREVLDLELTEPIDPEDVLRRFTAEAPPGFDFLEVEEAIAPTSRPARVMAATYHLPIPDDQRDAARAAVAILLTRDSWPITRHRQDRKTELDLRPFVLDAFVSDEGALSVPPQDRV